MLSAFDDYLDGQYPHYDTDLFVRDFLFSISRQANGRKTLRIKLSPKLFDHDVRILMESYAPSFFETSIEFIKDVNIDAFDVDFEEIYFNEEHREFSNFLVAQDKMVCSVEDFRLINLYELYKDFKKK